MTVSSEDYVCNVCGGLRRTLSECSTVLHEGETAIHDTILIMHDPKFLELHWVVLSVGPTQRDVEMGVPVKC